MNRLSILLLSFVVSLGSWPVEARHPELEFEHVGVEDGLSHASVFTIAQDANGFLWFGTGDGLNRYDGAEIVVYRHDPADSNSLSSSNFGEILLGRSGILWLGTWGGGLTRYDPRTHAFRRYLHDPADPRSLSEDRIEAVCEDSHGSLWIATEMGGLNRLDDGEEQFERYRHDAADPRTLGSDQVKEVYASSSGELWIGTDDGLDLLDRESGRFTHFRHDPGNPESLSSDRVRAIAEDRSGALWIGTRGGGLNRFDPRTGKSRRFRHDPADPRSLSDDSIASLLVDSSGVLWIGTYDGGLGRFDPRTEEITSYQADPRVPSSLSHNRVETLFEDRANNLWIGTRGGGVDKIDLKPSKFEHLAHDPNAAGGLPHPSVMALTEAAEADGEGLWIGTDGGGLVRFQRVPDGSLHGPRRRAVADLSSDRVWAVRADRAGALWVGTYDAGLNRVVRAGESFAVTHYRHDPRDPASLSNDRVQYIHEDLDGDLWLGTADGLNRIVDPSRDDLSFAAYDVTAGEHGKLSSNYVTTIAEDAAGALWIGTRDGVFRFDKTAATFERIGEVSAVSDSVLVVLADARRAGTLWAGTEGAGLRRLDAATRTSVSYLVEDGLASGFVGGILEDGGGALWLSTSSGISRFDPESESFRNYDAGSGLENYGFNRNASLRSRDGEMFFGGIAGLTRFHPDRIRDNPHPPPVVLTSLRIFNEEMTLDRPLHEVDAVELDYRENFLLFEFAALDFTSPPHNEYAYMLEGVDADWIAAGSRDYASYANLAPGGYVFKVKAANNDGVWNERGRSLRITVIPPFWKTTAFYLVSVVALTAAVFSAHQLRLSRVRRRNAHLQEINAKLNLEIAERQRAELEKERLILELRERNAEMEQFAHTVSHDLKSPLVTIKGFLGLLRRDSEAGDRERMAGDIEQIGGAADRMSRLLDELLEISRIGRQANPLTAIDVAELIDEARSAVAGQILERGVAVDVAAGLPTVVGDRVRIYQVFQNLIENAVKFMGDQAEPRIEIGAEPGDSASHAVFYVRDNGRGIDRQYHERIFNIFESLGADGGTGVGLAVVKRVIEVHGGRIWVESVGEGRGSTFYFTLPRHDAAA